jgi:hypothetical protein
LQRRRREAALTLACWSPLQRNSHQNSSWNSTYLPQEGQSSGFKPIEYQRGHLSSYKEGITTNSTSFSYRFLSLHLINFGNRCVCPYPGKARDLRTTNLLATGRNYWCFAFECQTHLETPETIWPSRPCTCPRSSLCSVLMPASSNQAPLRHTENTTYRCFLPDLTEFIAPCCVEPSHQHRLARATLQARTSNRNSAPL